MNGFPHQPGMPQMGNPMNMGMGQVMGVSQMGNAMSPAMSHPSAGMMNSQQVRLVPFVFIPFVRKLMFDSAFLLSNYVYEDAAHASEGGSVSAVATCQRRDPGRWQCRLTVIRSFIQL